jgi:hypothetical protein
LRKNNTTDRQRKLAFIWEFEGNVDLHFSLILIKRKETDVGIEGAGCQGLVAAKNLTRCEYFKTAKKKKKKKKDRGRDHSQTVAQGLRFQIRMRIVRQ